MAHGRKEFALVGYSEYLERRPLKFVDPIPASRICSACGIIPRITYTLLCGHTFCEPCYGSCVTTSECVCPLDGDVCDRDDVTRKEYPAEQLLRRQVHCWNEANGCLVILPASQIAEHVRQDCQYHVTRCPTCSVAVLTRDVCAHLKSRCTALVFDKTPEPQQRANVNERTHLELFEKKVEQRVRELDAKLAQLSLKSDSLSDKLIEICHNDNHLKEALTEQFGTASNGTLDRLDRNEAEMKALVAQGKTIEQRVGELDAKIAQITVETGSLSEKLKEIRDNNIHLKEAITEEFGSSLDHKLAEMKVFYTEQIEFLRTSVTSAVAPVASDSKTHQRVITGYVELKAKAMKDGWCVSWGEKVYLRRYLISWGIDFIKEGHGVNAFLIFQLHEGREDDFLDWPFTKKLKLTIIHPETRKELHREGQASSDEAYRKHFCRPVGSSNEAACFLGTKVDSTVLEHDGYVKNDQLLLRVEVIL
ncbi:uncharacterized protein LOC144137975 isoform X1 [Haemaphysalis longicornis]